MDWCNIIFSGSAGAFVGALAGVGTACYMAKQNQKNEEEKLKRKVLNDIYCVVTQLGGFINYFQYACHMNSALTTTDYQNIIDRIYCINKDIIDPSQQFFYNSEFKENVQRTLSGFLELYIGWKGYRPLMLTEIFFEYIQINNMQIRAIECLNKIIKEYPDDKKLVNFIENVVNHKDTIEEKCKSLNKKMKFIFNNLTYIFGDDNLFCNIKKRLKDDEIDNEEIKRKIICQVFKHIHGKDMFQFKDNAFGKALFNEQFQSVNLFFDEGIMTINIEGEHKFSFEDVEIFLYSLYVGA